jgi:Ca-activated chloride channel family protein
MLALDTSASMAADDVSPTRLDAAKAQARLFVAKLPKGLKVGLVSFATSASVHVAPTTDRTTVLAGIDALAEGQGTATGDAITLALQAIKTLPPDASGKPAPAAIVLMSDGTPTVTSTGGDPAQAAYDAAGSAKAARVPIDTIAFGTAEGTINLRGQEVPVPSDPQTMARIASASGGKSFTATSATQLRAVYDSIGRAVGYDVHKHDVSEWFTFLGLALAVAAAAGALVWTQRLV